MNGKKNIKRFISLFLVFVILSITFTFFAFRPVKVKAEAISLATIGAGALTAVVLSYLITSGVQLVFNGSASTSTLDDYVNSLVDSYETQEQVYQTWFDSDGAFIGTEDDMVMLLDDQAKGYYSMGKDLNAWLEGLKDWFVDSFSLDSTSKEVYEVSKVVIGNKSYPFFDLDITYKFENGPLISSVVPMTLGEHRIDVNSDYYYICNLRQLTDNGTNILYDYIIELHLTSNNTLVSSKSSSVFFPKSVYPSINNFLSFQFAYDIQSDTFGLYGLRRVNTNSFTQDCWLLNGVLLPNTVDVPTDEMSVEGALTDGYQDFQDALDNALQNEQSEDAVVALDVGTMEGVQTGSQFADDILTRILANTFEGSLDGVYENQETAEEELAPVETPAWRPNIVIVDGLEDFFPFCIPWDLYSIISALNVEPVAPRFTYHMSFGSQFDAQDLVIDLSPYETVARVFRYMVVIGFVIFLIIKTRDMIRG